MPLTLKDFTKSTLHCLNIGINKEHIFFTYRCGFNQGLKVIPVSYKVNTYTLLSFLCDQILTKEQYESGYRNKWSPGFRDVGFNRPEVNLK